MFINVIPPYICNCIIISFTSSCTCCFSNYTQQFQNKEVICSQSCQNFQIRNLIYIHIELRNINIPELQIPVPTLASKGGGVPRVAISAFPPGFRGFKYLFPISAFVICLISVSAHVWFPFSALQKLPISAFRQTGKPPPLYCEHAESIRKICSGDLSYYELNI